MTAIELLVDAIVRSHPDEAAYALEALRPTEAAALLDDLEPAQSAAVVQKLEVEFAAATLQALDVGVAAEIVAALAPTAAALILRRMAAAPRDQMLAACPRGFASAVRPILASPARTAGALMDPQAPSLPQDLAVSAALAVVRERPERFKHYIYLVDRAGLLVGVTRLVDLVAARSEVLLEELMRTPVARVAVDDLEVAVIAHPGWASYRSLPVVDRGDRLVGVLRDEVVQSIRRERGAQAQTPISLALSLAELFWLGLAGVTEGVAAVVGREAAASRANEIEEVEKR